MLPARSSSEAHLYMDLHPCECGSVDFERGHRLEQLGNDIVAVYEGVCRQCGRIRRFTFLMAEDIPPPPPAFGGPEPSQIIDPGEFLDVAFRIAETTGVRLLNAPDSEQHTYRGAVAYALAAYEEVLKFIPPGQNAVPASAFTSEVGRTRYQSEPGNFRRDVLELSVKNARAVLADIDKAGRPPQNPQ
ncbi:hypothetical protein [Streptomyces durhamensis]|uniref:hypothetical protein n=1 Tax=Streptomyces durhamensis TaxID=68194 RepID=UPI0004CDC401|nr:hypothetical protein [Streptomyces durhamensis]